MSYDGYETSTYDGSPVELYEFTNGPAQTVRYNTGPKTIIQGGFEYPPLPIVRGKLEQNAAEAPPMVEIVVPDDCPVATEFVVYLPANAIGVKIFRRHRDDPAAEYVAAFIGIIASVRFEDGRATLSCRPVLASLSRQIPWLTYLRTCNWALYSAGCAANRELFRVPGVLISNGGTTISAAAFASQADGWFTGGWVRSDRTGEVRFIISHTNVNLELQAPFRDLVAGDTLSAYAGCDRTAATCSAKFNNLARYAGWPDVPSKNPFAENVFGYKA